MLVRSASLVTLAAGIALVQPAVAAGPSISANPNPVHRGHVVRVHGVVPGCVPGDQVTLISHAFSHRHNFAGVSAVFARLDAHHAYSVRTTIPASRRPGRYVISGRCGGGNLGVSTTLRVLR
jgi:hypothetical protein